MADLHVERRRVVVGRAELEVTIGGSADPGAPTVCAAHPSDDFSEGTISLLAEAARARVVCVNPRGVGRSSPWETADEISLDSMVEDLEAVRRALGMGPWVYWGMSGGGFLGLLYAGRYPDALAGLILESTCACFRERLADPACILSPFHPAWRDALAKAGLLASAPDTDPKAAVGAEWIEVPGVGSVFRRRGGAALLVSPMPLSPEMRRVMPALWAYDARSVLRAVRTPTLVLCGTADPVVPVPRARAVHEAIAGSGFVALEGATHVPVVERREEVGGIVRRFLRERVSPARG